MQWLKDFRKLNMLDALNKLGKENMEYIPVYITTRASNL
jgi:hypothetical protein